MRRFLPTGVTWARFLLGCAGLLLLAVALVVFAGYLIARHANRNPAEVEALAREILEFKDFDRYRGQFANSILGKTVVSLSVQDDHGTYSGDLLLTNMVSQVDADKTDLQYQEGEDRIGMAQGIREGRPSEVFQVRGKATPIQVTRFIPKQGPKRLFYVLYLKGKTAETVRLSISAPEQDATHAWVQSVLDTVK